MKAQEPTLSHRVMVQIKRGITDDTPAIVWQHEIPILEAIHGEGNVRDVTAEATARMDDKFKAKKGDLMKLPPSQALGLGEVFDGDHEAEYVRLTALYGRHPEENVLTVQFVYGRFSEGRFSATIGTPAVTHLGTRQLRDKLTEAEITYPPQATRSDLAKLLQGAPA
jgi:hypothetical protein